MKDNDTETLMEEMVMQIRAQEVPAFPRELMAARLAALPKERGGASEEVQRSVAGWRMWQMLAAGALAAAVVVAALWFLPAVEGKQALAFEEVQKAVKAKQTMRYRILHYSNNEVEPPEPTVSQLYYSGNRMRKEYPLERVSIVDFDKGVRISIRHRLGQAEIDPIYGTRPQEMNDDFRTKLRNVAESDAKRLPDRQMNGRTVSEFLMRVENREFKVTVDPRTKLPIRVEVVYPKPPEKGQSAIREVYTDFVFDEPLDEALFRVEAPEGFEVINRVPRNRQPNPPETRLVVSPEDGIGPVKFGTKVEEIVRLLGEPDWRHDREDVNALLLPGEEPPAGEVAIRTELRYDRRGFRLTANDWRGLYSIYCFNNRDGVLATTEHGFRGKTKEGITLGASLDEVLKAYGKPEVQKDSDYVSYRKRGYDFIFHDKKLVSIIVNPANPYPKIETGIEVRGDQIKRVNSAK